VKAKRLFLPLINKPFIIYLSFHFACPVKNKYCDLVFTNGAKICIAFNKQVFSLLFGNKV
jgi:hypothetical protein